MFTELGDNLHIDVDQDATLVLITFDNETGIEAKFALTIEEAVFFRDKLDLRINEAVALTESDKR